MTRSPLLSRALLIAVTTVAFALAIPRSLAALQTTPAQSPAASASSPSSTTTRPRRRRRSRTAKPAAAPAVPAAIGETPAQKAQDAQLYQQQVRQQQATKVVNDQQVHQYDASQQKIQSEPRIQDAPGPAQTVTPGTTAPTSADASRIQDAPGPAQTTPEQTAPQPAQSAPQS